MALIIISKMAAHVSVEEMPDVPVIMNALRLPGLLKSEIIDNISFALFMIDSTKLNKLSCKLRKWWIGITTQTETHTLQESGTM